MNETLALVLVLALGTWLAAAIGAAIVSLFKKDNISLSRLIMGFAAGVILAVTFWEMLYPAMHPTGNEILPLWLVVPASFLGGVLFIVFLEKFIHKLDKKRKEAGRGGFVYRRSVMLTAALSFHNIPEGFALGIMLGALGAGFGTEELLAVIPMAIAVGLHKMPEGSVIAVSFRKEGMKGLKSFFMGQISGFIGFLLGIAGIVVVSGMDRLMPFALAFAGGAMVWVAVAELIPQSRGCSDDQNHKKSNLATIGVVFGIVAMLVLHTTFDKHDHHYHGDHAHAQHSHDHYDCDHHHHDHHDCDACDHDH